MMAVGRRSRMPGIGQREREQRRVRLFGGLLKVGWCESSAGRRRREIEQQAIRLWMVGVKEQDQTSRELGCPPLQLDGLPSMGYPSWKGRGKMCACCYSDESEGQIVGGKKIRFFQSQCAGYASMAATSGTEG